MVRRILLIDDDIEFRASLASALTALGHDVKEVGSAKDADFALLQQRPDLVVVDGLLPDATGIDWIARRRRVGDDTRMAFVSAFWRDPGSHARLREELGVSLIVHKPLDVSSLASELDALFGSALQLTERVRDVLSTLRMQYGAKLPGRLADAERLIADARLRGTRDALDAAISIAHRLRGTAGSYGFTGVSSAFGRIEESLRGVVTSGECPPPEGPQGTLWHDVDVALAEARDGVVTAPRRLDMGALAGSPPGRVLVVDDDPDFLRLVGTIATRSAIDVIPATTVDEALAIASVLPIDGAIVDVDLGGQPSFALVRQLRFLPRHEQLPVAFVSANSSLQTRAAAAHAGAIRFLSKPVELDSVLDLAGELVSLSRRNRPRVLVVDDDDDFAEHVVALLGAASIDTKTVHDADTALESMDTFRPDLVLADIFLPKITGLDLCRTIRLTPRWDEVPIVLATGRGDRETLVAAFAAGCDDYLTKPVLPEELLTRVRVRLDRAHLMRRASEIDPTTGLMIRRAFARQLNAAIQEARRHGRPLTLALIDLDRFKQVNDEQGHMAGDRVLEGIGALMRRSFRVYDIMGRWGGEELIVVLPGESPKVGAGVVERLLAEVRDLPFEGERGTFHVSFTAGIASCPDDGDTLEALVSVADERLYMGKRSGRNRVIQPESTSDED
ncbi:MAG: response regulator [Myxococcales bacterium]|nr:response regulator [Myxococcales bacterium]